MIYKVNRFFFTFLFIVLSKRIFVIVFCKRKKENMFRVSVSTELWKH